MGPVPLGVGVPAVEEVLAEVDVVVVGWVVAARDQVRVVSAPVRPVARGCHIGLEYRAMSFPVPSAGPRW